MNRAGTLLLLSLTALLLVSCGGGPKDGPPARELDADNIPDAVPRYEPITKAGNKSPYVVLGKQYYILPTFKNYRARGVASWYGTKFHGRNTSNGEPYNMYSMTAAHKTLPIPCYVRVTNLDNGRTAIVRVNDRGPFHDDRIIDLSYAAAKKLGVYGNGTANVEVVAIDPASYQRNTVEAPAIAHHQQTAPAEVARAFLQVGAFSSSESAEVYRRRATGQTDYPVEVNRVDSGGRTLFKVLVGPFEDRGRLLAAQNDLHQRVNLSSFVVYH